MLAEFLRTSLACCGLLSGALLQAQCPEVAFIYADACEAPDGKGEFLVLDNGDSGLPVNDLTLETPSGLEVCMGCRTEWEEPDVSELNALAGCGDLFLGIGPGDVLPAGARMVVFTNRNFKDDVDWSNFCPDAPVYALTIDKVDNTDKYTHNTGTCPLPAAVTSLDFGAAYGCGSYSVEYYPCMLPVETPAGSGGGYGVVFADGAAEYRQVGCELFYIDIALLETSLSFPASENLHDKIPLQILHRGGGQIHWVEAAWGFDVWSLQGQRLMTGSLAPGSQALIQLPDHLAQGLYKVRLQGNAGSSWLSLRVGEGW